jgi:hypothetical protein
MERDDETPAASVGAARVRNYRARRRAAGLVEVKAWVRENDVPRAWAALRPLTNEAAGDLARRDRQARTNQVVIELRFSTAPPVSFRVQLQQEWDLTWDRAASCWRGVVEDADRVEALRRLVEPHEGRIEARA